MTRQSLFFDSSTVSRFVYSKTFLYVCAGLNVDKMKQAGYFFFIKAPQVMRTGGSMPQQRRDEQAAVSEFPEALMKEEITGEKPTQDVLLKFCKAGDFKIFTDANGVICPASYLRHGGGKRRRAVIHGCAGSSRPFETDRDSPYKKPLPSLHGRIEEKGRSIRLQNAVFRQCEFFFRLKKRLK
jgi:hypothetical protein